MKLIRLLAGASLAQVPSNPAAGQGATAPDLARWQQGGWPLTMFLTPSGEPFWGGTYFPPEPRYGRPGMAQILEQVAALWQSGSERIESNRTAIVRALQRLSAPRRDRKSVV